MKYKIGDPIGLNDYAGEPVLVGDVVMCFDARDPTSPWKYHFTNIYEKELRCENANNVAMWDPPIINLGPFWRLLKKENHDRVNGRRLLIDATDLEYNWGVTLSQAVKMCIDELPVFTKLDYHGVEVELEKMPRSGE